MNNDIWEIIGLGLMGFDILETDLTEEQSLNRLAEIRKNKEYGRYESIKRAKKPDICKGNIVKNYFKASSALMNIGITENIPGELRALCVKASKATSKIIDYVNKHKEEFK